jgi:hypothetical protein
MIFQICQPAVGRLLRHDRRTAGPEYQDASLVRRNPVRMELGEQGGILAAPSRGDGVGKVEGMAGNNAFGPGRWLSDALAVGMVEGNGQRQLGLKPQAIGPVGPVGTTRSFRGNARQHGAG